MIFQIAAKSEVNAPHCWRGDLGGDSSDKPPRFDAATAARRMQNQMNINAEPITSGECCLEVSFANASVSPLAKWKPWEAAGWTPLMYLFSVPLPVLPPPPLLTSN